MSHNIKPGVATGKEVQEIFKYAKKERLCYSRGKHYRLQ